jgi:hypothetical protein
MVLANIVLSSALKLYAHFRGRWSFEIENVLVVCVNEKRKKAHTLPKANEAKYKSSVRKNTHSSR